MQADLRHRHDLHHQWRRDGRQERAPGHVPRRRQGRDHQAAAARLRRARSTRSRRRNTQPTIPRSRWRYDPELAKKLLAASGYSQEKPVKFTIQTTRGFKPKDYEMIQAIVGMWRKVGIDAEHRSLRDRQALRAAHCRTSSRRRRSTTGAMRSAIRPASTGFAMFSQVAALGLAVATTSTPRSGRSGARRTRRSASRAGRPSTVTSPSRAT